MLFRYGVEWKGYMFGWFEKELYRLPIKAEKNLLLKKLNPIKVGKRIGYRLRRDKLSVEQIKSMTKVINVKVEILKPNKDLP
jgi:hypothetical protein